MLNYFQKLLLPVIIFSVLAASAYAQSPQPESHTMEIERISKELANPVTDLANFPIRYDYDSGFDNNGERSIFRLQPIFRKSINSKYSLLSRTVIPIANQYNVIDIPGDVKSGTQSGLQDIQESIFLTMKTSGSIMAGIGPIVSIPMFYDGLSTNYMLLGPTGIIIAQPGKWTVGVLANHLWSVAGPGMEGEGYFSQTMVQPIVTYQFGLGWSMGFNAESFYDWRTYDLTIPLTVTVTKVFKIGSKHVSLAAGPKYYVEHPDNGPEWGIRAVLTFVL